jgi:hypothetical protein
MKIDRIFNELSFNPLSKDESAANEKMICLVDTLIAAHDAGITGAFRIPEDFYVLPIAPDYSVYDWVSNRRNVNFDYQSLLSNMATQIPFLSGFEDVYETSREEEYFFDSQRSLGIGIAHLLDGLSVSFFHSNWDTNNIEIKICRIKDNSVVEDIEHVIHANHPKHIATHKNWIEKRLLKTVRDGKEMWQRREEFFPSLLFCDRVEKQICALTSGSEMIQPIMHHLLALNDFNQICISSGPDLSRLRVSASRDSTVTLNQYSEEREFRCPDGIVRIFSLHTKISLNAWRIHFYFENQIIIGHIGEHLPTVKHH